MQVNAQNIADLIGGTVEGDPEVIILKPCKIEEGESGGISFLGNPKYEEYAYTTRASALLVGQDFVPKKNISATLIRVENVYAAIAQLLDHFGQAAPEEKQGEISPLASVHPEAVLGEGVSVGPFSIIEAGAHIGKGCRIAGQVFIGRDARIGENCHLSQGVRFLYACEMGRDCFLHPNVVVGSDGFGFAPREDGSYRKISQVGKVIIGDEVEIGSNTTIDRATMGATRIGNGVKLDNLIMIAHNVEIGDHTVIAGQAGIAGSTKIGKYCRIGGQVGFSGHLNIADGTQMQAQSGVGASIMEPGKAFFGTPAIPYKDYIRSYGVFKKLPELYRKIGQLERLVKELKDK